MKYPPQPIRILRLAFILVVLAVVGLMPAIAQDATPASSVRYDDPAGYFSVAIPDGWVDQSSAEFGTFDNGQGVTAYIVTVETDDVQAAIAEALARVAPDVSGDPAETRSIPAPNGIWIQNVYAQQGGVGPITVALALAQDGMTYVEAFRAVNAAAVQTANGDIGTFVLSFKPANSVDLSGAQPAALTEANLAALTDYVRAKLAEYDVVGASVAVVQNGRIIYSHGFGARSVGGAPVDADTLFMIGSTTKSMTTMMMGTLVDDGILDWDTPVTDILPTFALADPTVTPAIRVRDLMGNASGVPRYDIPLLLERLTPDEMIDSLRTIPLVAKPGEQFNYSNQMVTAGGYIAAIAAGATFSPGGASLYKTYAELMQARVFDPIGMPNTTLDFDAAVASENHATAYARDLISHERFVMPPSFDRFAVPVAPAGAVWSSAADMARYLETELSGGVAPNGTRVISEANLAETQTPQIKIYDGLGYGMGWMIGDYHGQTLIMHGGNTSGYTSDFGFLPDADLGVLVLVSSNLADNFAGAVREYAFEQAFGLDHSADEYYRQAQQSLDNVIGGVTIQFNLEAIAPESAQALVGDYEGGLKVVLDDAGQLLLRAPFGDIPLYFVAQQEGLYISGGAGGGLAIRFGTDADGTATFSAGLAVSLGGTEPPKTYKKLS